MILAEIFIKPSNNTILPPFTSKVGKTILKDPKNVSISPLKSKGKYLFKNAMSNSFITVESDQIYSFEVGGEDSVVLPLLTRIDNTIAFNTVWNIVDLKVEKPKVHKVSQFEVEILTPALLVHPHLKSQRKVFTNLPSFLFFTNVLDLTGLKRGDEKLMNLLNLLDSSLWMEPSLMSYIKVIYAGKEVVGFIGKLKYSVVKDEDIIFNVLEDAVVRGIGSSRRNGFGRVKVIT